MILAGDNRYFFQVLVLSREQEVKKLKSMAILNGNICVNSFIYATVSRRKKNVAWVVSHCSTFSKREEYVYELQKHIDVDVFGNCGSYCGRLTE